MKERKRREEKRWLVCSKCVGEEAIYTRNGAAAGEEKEELMWCRVFSWLQNIMIPELT